MDDLAEIVKINMEESEEKVIPLGTDAEVFTKDLWIKNPK